LAPLPDTQYAFVNVRLDKRLRCGTFSTMIFSKIILLKVLLGFGFGLLILALL